MPRLIWADKVEKSGLETKEYNRAYYKKNKERLAKQKKFRWETDEEYRNRIIERKRESRAKNPHKKKGLNCPRLVLIDGKPSFFTGRHALSQETAITYRTVTAWLKKGILPVLYDSTGKPWINVITIKKCKKLLEGITDVTPSKRTMRLRGAL